MRLCSHSPQNFSSFNCHIMHGLTHSNAFQFAVSILFICQCSSFIVWRRSRIRPSKDKHSLFLRHSSLIAIFSVTMILHLTYVNESSNDQALVRPLTFSCIWAWGFACVAIHFARKLTKRENSSEKVKLHDRWQRQNCA